jgi:hypothetical protein
MFDEQPIEVPHPDSQARSERSHAVLIKRPFHYQPERSRHCCTRTVPSRRKWSGFRPAPQARPKSSCFCRCRRREESHVFRTGRVHGADRPAVDAGCSHARKKASIVTSIPGNPGAFAFRGVQYCRLGKRPTTESECGESSDQIGAN